MTLRLSVQRRSLPKPFIHEWARSTGHRFPAWIGAGTPLTAISSSHVRHDTAGDEIDLVRKLGRHRRRTRASDAGGLRPHACLRLGRAGRRPHVPARRDLLPGTGTRAGMVHELAPAEQLLDRAVGIADQPPKDCLGRCETGDKDGNASSGDFLGSQWAHRVVPACDPVQGAGQRECHQTRISGCDRRPACLPQPLGGS